MEAAPNMKLLASWMSLCMMKQLPDFENADATSKFIAENKKVFDELPMKEKNKKYRKAKLLADRITSVDSSKLKFYVGRWLGNKMRRAEAPLDSIENINEADCFDMAKMYWEEEGKEKWQYLKKLDGKQTTNDELLPYIARDIDYRIIKATAKYIFKVTDKNAGVVVIDPDTYPYSQIKVQYRETYSILKDEAKSYIFQVDEKREYLR